MTRPSTQWQSIRLKARQPLAPQRKSIQLNSSVSALAVGDDVLDRETDVTKQLAEAKRFLIRGELGQQRALAEMPHVQQVGAGP